MKYFCILFITFLLSLNQSKSDPGEWRVIDTLDCSVTIGYVDIDCADDFHCIAVANWGMVASKAWINISTDGGLNWNNTYQEKENAKPYNIAYPDTSLCIITGDSGYYWRSIDKGFTWNKYKIDSITRLSKIKFCNKNFGVIKGHSTLVSTNLVLTSDGGLNWQRKEVNVNNKPDSVYFYAIFDLWIDRPGRIKLLSRYRYLGTNAFWGDFITETTDNGDTWLRKEAWIPKSTEKMFFFDSLNGFLVGRPGTGKDGVYSDYIVETTDGGNSWITRFDSVFKGDCYGLNQIYFRNRMNGAALGPFYKLLRTTDGGITWERDSAIAERVTGPVSSFSDIALLSNGDIIGIEGENTHIWKYSEHWTSVDDNLTQINNYEAKIYPNPWMPGKDLRLALNFSKETDISLSLYNNLGEEILKSKNYTISGKKELLITPDINLSPGVYFIKINYFHSSGDFQSSDESNLQYFIFRKFMVLN
jgi:photosystem II stability/assembly factor-like uncharacterized protein